MEVVIWEAMEKAEEATPKMENGSMCTLRQDWYLELGESTMQMDERKRQGCNSQEQVEGD